MSERYKPISNCRDCEYSDHKGAFGKIAYLPVCRLTGNDLPYVKTLNGDRVHALMVDDIPDWCKLPKLDNIKPEPMTDNNFLTEFRRRYPELIPEYTLEPVVSSEQSDQVTCGYSEPWIGICSNTASQCEKHDKLRCVKCKKKAVRGCEETSQFVCGTPLCADCECACTVKR